MKPSYCPQLLLLLPFLSLPPTLALPIPTPYDFNFNLFGVKPVSLSISPSKILAHSEPFIFQTTTQLANYQEPEVMAAEPNRILAHMKNTQAHVDQNGVPWARPPPPGNVDMEALLDERHYQRYEQMIRDGTIMVEEGPDGERRLVYTAVFEAGEDGGDVNGSGLQGEPGTGPRRKAVDVEYGSDMLSLLGKNNGLEKDSSGKTVYEKYLAGEIDVTEQSIYGNSIPKELSDDEAVRLKYGLAPAQKKAPYQPGEEQQTAVSCEEPETPEWTDEDHARLARCLGLGDQVQGPYRAKMPHLEEGRGVPL